MPGTVQSLIQSAIAALSEFVQRAVALDECQTVSSQPQLGSQRCKQTHQSQALALQQHSEFDTLSNNLTYGPRKVQQIENAFQIATHLCRRW